MWDGGRCVALEIVEIFIVSYYFIIINNTTAGSYIRREICGMG